MGSKEITETNGTGESMKVALGWVLVGGTYVGLTVGYAVLSIVSAVAGIWVADRGYNFVSTLVSSLKNRIQEKRRQKSE